ncbi:hypothetical protein F5B19DRAFT_95910 [Rostrohypoxylon terebratum]|nr:hypothetical protein F5B19DRAFT_95910 [Rostrohypoxylon terebratum]
MALRRSPKAGSPKWPAKIVPTEIFLKIASHLLDRNDIKSMRLVNREFNTKTMLCFMNRVVFSFGPEQSLKLAKSLALGGDQSAFDLAGVIVRSNSFKTCAPHIKRLGLAIEVGESELASPHFDNADEIYLRPWKKTTSSAPPKPFQLQSQTPLGKVTTALEKHEGVFRLLTSATAVQELALSCDAGLGYLQGPDVNPFQPPGNLPVFSKYPAVQLTRDISHQVEFDVPYNLEILESKLAAMGVEPADVPGKINEVLGDINLWQFACEHRSRPPLPPRPGREDVRRPSAHSDIIRLQPDQLTRNQRWYLQRHLTAQHALLLSFVMTMIDSGNVFENLIKLNLARIPSFHLEGLCRMEFWQSLPQVEDVSLGVIPDWRALVQENQDDVFVAVKQLYPTSAIPKVYELLKNYIGVQTNIKRLHFEWLCGGEFAAGALQRNCHILPAPFLKRHRMVIDSRSENLLILPHIAKLSLKNCWFAPNVFYRIVNTMMRDHKLECLELESVSLSGPPILRGAMPDTEMAPLRKHKMGGMNGESEYTLREPPYLSWGSVIDALAPVQGISELLFQETNRSRPIQLVKDNKLRKLVFKSCGYVSIPDTRFISDRRFKSILIPIRVALMKLRFLQRIIPKMRQMANFMQISTDRHLGSVLGFVDPLEMLALEKVYGLKGGWNAVYGGAMINAAVVDGIFCPGMGRFSGTIERNEANELDYEPELIDFQMDTSRFENGYNDSAGLDDLLRKLEESKEYPKPERRQ